LECADLSVEALDVLPLSESIGVESENTVLQLILNFGSNHHHLMKHIQIGFLSEDGLYLWDEHFRIPPESVSHCVVEQIPHPSFPIYSRIISNFPEIFTCSAAMVSKHKNFTADVTVTQTLGM
jgi:hypothetical protein